MNDTAQLCRRCQQFNFKAIFNHCSKNTIPTLGRRIKPSLGLLSSDLALSPCELCRLIYAVRSTEVSPTATVQGQYHLRVRRSLELCGLSRNYRRDQSTIITVEQGGTTETLKINRLSTPYGVMAPVNQSAASQDLRPEECSGALVHPDQVNFDAVRFWLSHCIENHSSCSKTRPTDWSLPLRVLDCDSLIVVLWQGMLPKERGYFALSYAWDSEEPCDSLKETPKFCTQLSEQSLPQVIKDAVMVVKHLRPEGARYLWVDRYCVDQGDSDEKHNQIQGMDIIYEEAVATIIAANSEQSTASLPGMGFSSRNVQPSAFAEGVQMVSTLPHISTVLNSTRWAKRGWTYQEAMLSRRCLIFTDYQVYYVCCQDMNCESVVKHPTLQNIHERLPAVFFENKFVTKSTEFTSTWKVFTHHVKQYSQRILSYDKDGLNAFLGILVRCGWTTYWGIPIDYDLGSTITTDVDIIYSFAERLCWSGTRLRRRKCLPSWSWTGWTGNINFCEFYRRSCSPLPNTLGAIEIWVEKPDGSLIELTELVKASNERAIRQQSQFLHIKAGIIQIRIQRPIALDSSHSETIKLGWICFKHINGVCPEDQHVRDQLCSFGGSNVDLYPSVQGYKKLFSRSWDALILSPQSKASNSHTVSLLIVKWNGNTASRLGLVTDVLQYHIMDQILYLNLKQRTIRLG